MSNEEPTSPEAETLPTPLPKLPAEEPTPMLDVHPAHHAANTWREFFIHIATIVLGLLIAVGLEQTVEKIHHRREVDETREALRKERVENYARFDSYVNAYKRESTWQQHDMDILTALQRLGRSGSPDASEKAKVLHWSIARNQFATTAWHTAQGSGVLTLMPAAEVTADERVYNALRDVGNQNEEEWLALNEATRFSFTDPDASHLAPPQLAEEIGLMQKLMMKHYLRGNFMGYPNLLDPKFNPGPSDHDLDEFRNRVSNAHDVADTLVRRRANGAR
jgi:hypothetical protein